MQTELSEWRQLEQLVCYSPCAARPVAMLCKAISTLSESSQQPSAASAVLAVQSIGRLLEASPQQPLCVVLSGLLSLQDQLPALIWRLDQAERSGEAARLVISALIRQARQHSCCTVRALVLRCLYKLAAHTAADGATQRAEIVALLDDVL